VERHDQDDGQINYEIWCQIAPNYHRVVTLNDWDNEHAREDAKLIVKSVNEAEPDGVNYYDSHEALVDLVQLWAEHEALNGGGPGWQKRFNAALAVAHELTRREP